MYPMKMLLLVLHILILTNLSTSEENQSVECQNRGVTCFLKCSDKIIKALQNFPKETYDLNCEDINPTGCSGSFCTYFVADVKTFGCPAGRAKVKETGSCHKLPAAVTGIVG